MAETKAKAMRYKVRIAELEKDRYLNAVLREALNSIDRAEVLEDLRLTRPYIYVDDDIKMTPTADGKELVPTRFFYTVMVLPIIASGYLGRSDCVKIYRVEPKEKDGVK